VRYKLKHGRVDLLLGGLTHRSTPRRPTPDPVLRQSLAR
jgi:hypothetical protein